MSKFNLRRLAFSGLLLWSFGALAEHYTVPLFVWAATADAPQGVLRILNGTDESGMVEIYAIDDAGTRSGPATFTLNASAAVEFTATDLQSGNATLGLTGGIGTDVGDARLVIETDLRIVPLAYVRAAHGTVSAMQDTVRAAAVSAAGQYRYDVPIFNLSTDVTQVSRLRLINPGDTAAAITIEGRDDSGAEASGGSVQLTLAAEGAQTLTAQQLEAGSTGLTGQLGAGTGRWRLTVSADRALQVVNIVAASAGYWNNLSTTAVPGAAPADREAFNGRFVDRGFVYRTDSGETTFTAEVGDRFTETGESDAMAVFDTGSYAYEAIGPDAGLLTVSYDDNDECEANLYFSSLTRGWFASRCTDRGDPYGYWVAGNWSVADEAHDAVTLGVEEALSGVPASGVFVPPVLVGVASFSAAARGTTIALNDRGYFELSNGTRYTCTSAAGCVIENATVIRGAIAGTAAGTGELDTFPTFRTATALGNRTNTAGTAIDTLTLPEASGGDGTLTYSLSPNVPGLSFDAATRRLAGTPTAAASYATTYTVTDSDGDTDALRFTLTVAEADDGNGSEVPEFDLHNDNNWPEGIAYANDRLFVVDSFDGKIYAYGDDGQGDATAEFDLHEDNDSPKGIAYANDRFYVVDEFDGKIYAYGDDGQRDATAEFDLHDDNDDPRGIVHVNDRFYVVDWFDERVFVYRDTGQRDTAAEFDLHDDNNRPWGIAHANDRFYVVDEFDAKVYAYRAVGQRDAVADFDLHDDNGYAAGIVHANGRFYVVDWLGKVYVYPDAGTSPAPDLGSTDPDDRTYRVGMAIDALTLPEAGGGDGTLTYSLSPDVPGLSFNAATRRLTGTPTVAGTYSMTYTVTDADGDTDSLSFTIAVEASEDDGDGAIDYGVDDTLPGVPRSGVFVASVLSGGSVSATAGGTTVALDEGGYFELSDGTRYTCTSADGCTVANGTVTRGTLAGRAAGSGEVDRFPSFRAAVSPGDQTYTVGTAIDGLTLPEASGGNGTLSYSLSPNVPGLSFNATARQLTGTPTAAASYATTYTVTDSDGDTDALRFTLTVAEADDGNGSEVPEFELHDDNNSPWGIAYANDRLFVVDSVDGKIYAYGDDGQRDATAEFDLHDDNSRPEGIAYANDRLFVVDALDDKIYAYGDDGQRDATAEFDLHDDNNSPEGIAYANDRLFVVDSFDDKIYAYGDDGQRDAIAEFDLHDDNSRPRGIAYANDRLFVVDWYDGKIYAYGDDGQRDATAEFDLHDDNDVPRGIVHVNDRFYVVDWLDARVFVYPDAGTSPAPDLGSTDPDDRTYRVGMAIDALTLPEAGGGDGTLTYSLSPDVPGLSFNAATRRLTGTPTVTGTYSMTYTVTDADGDTDSLSFTIAVEASEDDGDGAIGYGVDDTLPGVPRSGVFVASVLSGGSVSATAGGTTVALDEGGYFELSDGTRYTCTSADGCTVANGTVTRGTLAGRAAGSGEVDRFPSFRAAVSPGDQTYTVGTAIDGLTLPEASGGNGTLSYSLSPNVPGLSFNATARQLTGTPTAAASYATTYTVTDSDGDTDALRFTLTVAEADDGNGSEVPEFELHDDNNSPWGIAYANDRLFVVDAIDGKIYAYGDDGQRDATAEFDLHDDNFGPRGIVHVNDRFYVVDWVDKRVFVYRDTGQRDTAAEFDLHDDNNRPRGIAHANDRLFVVDTFDGKIYAYGDDGQRDATAEFDLHDDNNSLRGIAYANDRLFVVDAFDGKIYAYGDDGQRDATAEFDLHDDNNRPWGIAHANDRFYVVDEFDGKVYAYPDAGTSPAPDLGSTDPDDRTYRVGMAIDALTLPEAGGGDGTLTYSLSPDVPGLSFNATARQLTGTPSTAGTYAMTYTVTDEDGDTDTLSFTITVEDGGNGGGGSETRYAVGDVITTLPTGFWVSDRLTGDASFRFSAGVVTIQLGNGGTIEEGSYVYTCEAAGGCEVVNREVLAGTIVQKEIPPTSGTAGTCEVDLGRSAGAGGTETVSVALSGALEAGVGTVDDPFVVRARMDNASDFDVYKIVLSDAGQLNIASGSGLDMQAVFLAEDCTEVGTVVEDLGRLANIDASNLDFGVSGDLNAGTYYLVVFEWASRIGNYVLGLTFTGDDGVNDTPLIEPVAHQEVAPGGTATVDVEVTDDTGDAHAIVATSDNEDVVTVDLRGSGSSRSLVMTAQAAGTATVTLRAVDQEDAVASPVTFDVIVAAPTLSAPTLEPGSNAGEIEVTVVTMLGPRETRAHDYQIRVKRPQTPWPTVGCHAITNNSDGTVTGPFSVTLGNNPAGLTYEVRYRYRNSSSCNAGSPGPWSAVGEGISGGTAANATPAFPEGASTDRSVNENVGGGINVGSPVAASDADGVRDVLAYSLGGADAGSFQIVPATGQIRTREGVTYDHEARDTYAVTVEANDVHSETDLISVDIHIVDLGAVCASPPRLRLNSGDGGLTVRWTPLADRAGSASVLGYEVERRDGTGGAWGNRQIIGGRATSNMTYTGLVNGRQYDVRIRPFGNEDPCDWSTPVSGIPTTDTAPRDQPDFEDRVPPGTQLRDWRFPVPGRFSEMRDGRQLDGSYRYVRTDPDRGTITFEYDEIGQSGCEVSLLFSSLTSGSFLDECEGAGVNVDVNFDIEEPPAPSSPLAPQTMEDFDALAFGKRNLVPGIFFGRTHSERVCPTCSPRDSGYFHRVRGNLEDPGKYLYENEGRASGILTLLFNNGDVWVFELEFIASDAAEYVVTIRRDGHAPLVLEGIIDFADDSNLNEFPPELLPPGSPPQASGNDLFGVDAATGSTSISIGGDSIQTILVQDGGIQDIAYQPGDWLEPKDGGNQRMMIVGSGQTSAPVAAGLDFRARTPAQANSAAQSALSAVQTDLIALSVVCMQIEKGIPKRGSRFFSQPKSPDGAVQTCQRNCVLARGDTIQRCVWECEASAAGATAVVDDIADNAMLQLLDALGGSIASEPLRTGARTRGDDLKSALPRID